MLLQSIQYVEEHGGNPKDIQVYGQEDNGTTWAICKMNMILHNVPDAQIENGDSIENPKIYEGASWKKFDRVIANPPFSQNYSQANMKFGSRFQFGLAPETGKKADLMFVQHMIASLKPTGKMATIMPHGVLFRGGTEKIIRQGIVDANIIEAIISLPPALFYGTGIPACAIIINKNKPDELRDKIFFINADAEYGEGKVQNFLRPEDIEKINFVFTNKREIPKYSSVVSKEKIASKENDYNLNIRRYVDNTPYPEPEDVKAHLLGGIPQIEIEDQKTQCAKFHFDANSIFEGDGVYRNFNDSIAEKTFIRTSVEKHEGVEQTFSIMQEKVNDWWQIGKEDFAKLAPGSEEEDGNIHEGIEAYLSVSGKAVSEVRIHLLTTLKNALLPLDLLDEFQVAGIFVNWWTNIKYDLKTISAIGWSPSLLPDEYFIEIYFVKERDEIIELDNSINEREVIAEELIESIEFEDEEDDENSEEENIEEESKTSKSIKDYLKAQIAELSNNPTATTELNILIEQLKKLTDLESELKALRKSKKTSEKELEFKIDLKRYGNTEYKKEYTDTLEKAKQELITLQAEPKPEAKKEKTAYNKRFKNLQTDIRTLEFKLKYFDLWLKDVGGKITQVECKTLILQKHNNLVNQELNKYLNVEKRKLIAGLEKLWDKYAVSSQELERERAVALGELNGLLAKLNYLN